MFSSLSKTTSLIPTQWHAISKWKESSAKVQVRGTVFTNKNTAEKDIAIQSDAGWSVPSPVIIRYFEVRIDKITETGVVGVGLSDSEFPSTGAQPGWLMNSYGYHSDDGCVYSLEINNKGKQFGPTFGQGDVIGCGINASGQVFFSKNGVYLGTAFGKIDHVTLYPTVGMDAPGQVTANFGTDPSNPFMLRDYYVHVFAPAAPSQPQQQQQLQQLATDITSLLPTELWRLIAYWAVDSAKDAVKLSKVSRLFYRVTIGQSANDLWRYLAGKRWVVIPDSKMKVDNWYKFYKRRAVALESKNDHPIENCVEWEYKCPIAASKLQRTADTKVDYCTVCKENVHVTENLEDLKKNVQMGRCVIWDPTSEIAQQRKPRVRPMMRGKMVYRPPADKTNRN